MLPEKLYRKLSQDYQKIRQTYDAYTQYYVDLGYEAFRDEWRQDMVQLLNSIDLACFNAKPLDLSDAKNGNWRATYWCNAGRPCFIRSTRAAMMGRSRSMPRMRLCG